MADRYLFVLDAGIPLLIVGEIAMEAAMIDLENTEIVRSWKFERHGFGRVATGKVFSSVRTEPCPPPSFPKDREVLRFKLSDDWETT